MRNKVYLQSFFVLCVLFFLPYFANETTDKGTAQRDGPKRDEDGHKSRPPRVWIFRPVIFRFLHP